MTRICTLVPLFCQLCFPSLKLISKINKNIPGTVWLFSVNQKTTMYLGVHQSSLGVLHDLTTWSYMIGGMEVFADGGLHPGQSTDSQAPGHLGEEAEVVAEKDRPSHLHLC